MRVIIVSMERVIDRWRGELSGRSIHNRKEIETAVSAPHRQTHTPLYISLYDDVPVTMSKLSPGTTEPPE